MDLASFYTTQNSASTQVTGGKAHNGLSNGGQGIDGIFELLLSQTEEQLDQQNRSELVKILASNEDIADDVAALDNILDLDLIEEIEQTLALNQKAFDAKLAVSKIQSEALQADKNIEEPPIPAIAKALNLESLKNADLSTLNLTPAQLSELADIQNGVVPTDEQTNTLQSFLAGLVALVSPASGQSDIIIPSQASLNSGKPASLDFAQTPTEANNLIARLNKLVGDQVNNQGGNTPLPFNSGGDVPIDGDFDAILKAATGNKYAGNTVGDIVADITQNNTNAANANASAGNASLTAQAQFNVLQAWPFGAAGSLFGSSSFSDQVAEQLGLSLNGSQSFSQGGLTALVSQAQSAGQAHPATQMVAASIQKAGVNGQDTHISVRLDPPDLGRVDVRMTFGKDKSVKAVVMIEKPDTFHMLQRDAQLLERALQDAGLDSEGGLSFEMAQDGEFMDQHNQRGGGHDSGGTGRGSGESEDGETLEIIESTMTWRVDAETGHTRYNIMA